MSINRSTDFFDVLILYRLGMVAHACNLALWEVKKGGSLEPTSSRLAWATQGHSMSIQKKNEQAGRGGSRL